MYVLPGGVVGVIDYGMMGSITLSLRSSLAQLLAGLAKGDHKGVMSAILESVWNVTRMSPPSFSLRLRPSVSFHFSQSLKDINLGEYSTSCLNSYATIDSA